MEVWGNKKLYLPGKADREVIRSQIRELLASDTPTMNGRIYPRGLLLRALARLRNKKTPLQRLTELTFNDDWEVEVEDPQLAESLARQMREQSPDFPRFTIKKLKEQDDGTIVMEIAFDVPVVGKKDLKGMSFSVQSLEDVDE
jgi:hypothetical protein